MKHRRIYAKIDLDAIEHNFSLIESSVSGNAHIMPVIKADAYGHGAVEIARFLEKRCGYFAVATVEEAVELRQSGITVPILLLGYTFPEQFEDAVRYDVSLTVFKYDDAVLLSETAEKLGKIATVHLAVDTGMSRIGFCADDVLEASKIFSLKKIHVEGIFSHFATADEADKTFSHIQKERFDKFVSALSDMGCRAELVHLSNSAGIMELSDSRYDMVRAGIILYGLYPSAEVIRDRFPLRPAMGLVTHISHIKSLPAGTGVSYGLTYTTDKETIVATLPVGYADGYPRALSNIGRVLVKGVSCPILGRVCMDQMMVDVTNVPNVSSGDEVILLGTCGDETITVEELAEPATSFNYEFVCNISRRVPRAYFKDGELIKTVSYLDY